MIRELQVESYRSFETFKVLGLSRVNLFTGKNNSGKTSILEAVEIIHSFGDPSTLIDIAVRRGELLPSDLDSYPGRNEQPVDAAHFFFGHNFRLGDSFSISTQNEFEESIVARVARQSEFEQQPELFHDDDSPLLLAIERLSPRRGKGVLPVRLSLKGGMGLYDSRRTQRALFKDESVLKYEFIGPDSLVASRMAVLWDRVLRDRKEQAVFRSLQLLDESIEDVIFLNDDRGYRNSRPGIVVGCRGREKRLPLGSFGEGMRRLLALSMSLATASGGILLIDEIDTGLHYSVLADMWKLVIGTAIDNDIQVFATTHSLDCLRGLNEACQANPEYAKEISVQTIDRNLPQSIDMDAGGLATSLSIGIEMR